MVTPAPQVKGDEDRNEMLCKRHVIVKVTHLLLDITVAGCICMFFNIAAEIITEDIYDDYFEYFDLQPQIIFWLHASFVEQHLVLWDSNNIPRQGG